MNVKHARKVRRIGESDQVQLQAHVRRERVRDADGRVGNFDGTIGLLLGARDAVFGFANVIEVVVEARAVLGTDGAR